MIAAAARLVDGDVQSTGTDAGLAGADVCNSHIDGCLIDAAVHARGSVILARRPNVRANGSNNLGTNLAIGWIDGDARAAADDDLQIDTAQYTVDPDIRTSGSSMWTADRSILPIDRSVFAIDLQELHIDSYKFLIEL